MITDTFDEVDRIHVFKHLSVNELDNTINMTIFENLLNDYYTEFVEFCDGVKNSSKKIKNVSCYIDDGKINFEVEEVEEEKK